MSNLIPNLIKKIEFEPNFKVAEFEFEPEPCDIAHGTSRPNVTCSMTYDKALSIIADKESKHKVPLLTSKDGKK